MGISQFGRREWGAGLAALALALTGAGLARAADPIPVTVALSSNSLAYGGLRIAEQLGIFAKNGLAVRTVVLDSGNAATAALISRSADFAGSGPGEVLTARARRQPIVIVANIYRGFAAPIVLSKAAAEKLADRQGAPVPDRYRALNGLVIAVPSATSALLAPVRASLEAAGGSAKFVYMAQPAMIPSLETGAVQGIVASSPFWSAPVLKGSGVLWLDAPHGEIMPGNEPASSAVLQTREDYAQARPDVIAKVRASFAELARAIAANPSGALAALRKAYPNVDPDALKLVFDHDASNWTRPVLSPEDVEQEKKLLKRSVDVPGLDEIAPAAVLLPSG